MPEATSSSSSSSLSNTNPPTAEQVLNVNVGVLGHVDSGKTSLVKTLSTLLSTAALDKSKQSRQRGTCSKFPKSQIPKTNLTASALRRSCLMICVLSFLVFVYETLRYDVGSGFFVFLFGTAKTFAGIVSPKIQTPNDTGGLSWPRLVDPYHYRWRPNHRHGLARR